MAELLEISDKTIERLRKILEAEESATVTFSEATETATLLLRYFDALLNNNLCLGLASPKEIM